MFDGIKSLAGSRAVFLVVLGLITLYLKSGFSPEFFDAVKAGIAILIGKMTLEDGASKLGAGKNGKK